MHPTQPLYRRDRLEGATGPGAGLSVATGAEVWHDGGSDLRERQEQEGRSQYLMGTHDGGTALEGELRDAGAPGYIASTTSSPTLVDTASPRFAKAAGTGKRSVSFAVDSNQPREYEYDDVDDGSTDEHGRHSSDVDPSLALLPDPVPWRTLTPLLMFLTADAMTYSVLFPIITDMLTSFRPAIAPDMIGLYAGLGEGVMMLVEALFSTFWARAADKYGRRGCLIWGFGFTVLGSAAIGWSRNVGTIILFRSLLGLNPSGVLARLMGAEISTPSNRAKLFSILSPSFSIGMLMGTLLGGMLAHPYGRLPAFLGGHAEIWRDWPFALPCVVIAAIDLTVVVVGWFMLVETKKARRGEVIEMSDRQVDEEAGRALLKDRQSLDVDTEAEVEGKPDDTSQHGRAISAYALPNPPPTGRPRGIIRATLAVPSFLLLTAVFLLFQISTFSWDGMYAVYTYTPPSNGGLGLPVDTIGVLYAVSYLASFALNPLLLPGLTARYGAKRSLMFALACWVVLGLLLPVSQWGAVEARGVMWAVVGMQVIIRALGSFGWALCDVLTLSCFDDYPELMATSSAISCIGGAGGRAFGPALSGWLYSISSEHPAHSWGRQISWIYITLASAPALIMAMRIPASADERASASATAPVSTPKGARRTQTASEGQKEVSMQVAVGGERAGVSLFDAEAEAQGDVWDGNGHIRAPKRDKQGISI